MPRRLARLALALPLLLSCSDASDDVRVVSFADSGEEPTDTRSGERSEEDATTADAGDTGAEDTGAEDTGAEDTGAEDTGAEDTGAEDANPEDTGAEDANPGDTGAEDTIPEDTSAEDTGAEDTDDAPPDAQADIARDAAIDADAAEVQDDAEVRDADARDDGATDASADVTSPDPFGPPVYMHYMPWFETPATLGVDAEGAGRWGWHWRMNTRDPNQVDSEGRRDIAAHVYPLIGPYASSDPHVIEYHFLLMRLAGVDGILVDWYGVSGTNGDIESLLRNSDALLEPAEAMGLSFGVVLEDRFAASASDVATNMAYLAEHYFASPAYAQGSEGPLVCIFGPITVESPSEWPAILSEAGEELSFFALPFQSGDVGSDADGEYFWPFEDEARDDHAERVRAFHRDRAPVVGEVGAVAYPGFEDFYAEGGAGEGVGFEIPRDGGATLDELLRIASTYEDEVAFLQLATWNDFGEGTVFEPSLEFGYRALEQVQEFTGAPFTAEDLRLAERVYNARVSGVDAALVDGVVAQALAGDAAGARAVLEALD